MNKIKHPNLKRKEVLLFATPLLVVGLSLLAVKFMQSAEAQEQALMRQSACSIMLYQPDGSTRPCRANHGWPRKTQWQVFVQAVKIKLRGE